MERAAESLEVIRLSAAQPFIQRPFGSVYCKARARGAAQAARSGKSRIQMDFLGRSRKIRLESDGRESA
jgi:hypothetical protein